MEELLLYVAKQLVDNPDAVTVTQREDGENTVLELRVAPEDMGKVIGKQGKIAKALRTLVRCASAKEGKKYNIEIKEKAKAE